MPEQEQIARSLLKSLRTHFQDADIAFLVEGRGVNWHVEARYMDRQARIDCLHYGEYANALKLGVCGNAHLSKVNVGPSQEPRSGARYFVALSINGARCSMTRTSDRHEVISALDVWLLERADRAEMRRRFSFIDKDYRQIEELANRVNVSLAALGSGTYAAIESVCDYDEFAELWVYWGDRSCRLVAGVEESMSCAFLERRTQLARAESVPIDDGARAIYAWTDEHAGLASIRGIIPGTETMVGAEAFERGDHCRWHWENVFAQAETSEVLTSYKPLITAIMESDLLSRYYSYTSLHRLCLSRSSLYPFDTEGLPVVCPSARSSEIFVATYSDQDRVTGPAKAIVADVEARLVDDHPPYFGNIDDRLVRELNAEMIQAGSKLRARGVQSREWLRVVVKGGGGRFCELNACHGGAVDLALHDALGLCTASVTAESVPVAARQLIAWFEESRPDSL